MNRSARTATVLSVVLAVCGPGIASAQTSFPARLPVISSEEIETRSGAADPAMWRTRPVDSASPPQAASGDTKVSVYPILLWVPAFTATTTVPPYPDAPDGPDLPGGAGSTEDSFDGAALAGVSIERPNWRVDIDGIWAALVTTRERPLLNVDLDIIYGHVSGGVKVYKDLYVTGGVRRLALKYDIELEGRTQHFVRKPGIWDPLVGLGYHGALGSRWTLHVSGEGGGFGAGADVDLAGAVRADVKLTGHFGLTFGYSVLYLKLSDTVLNRTLEVKQTLHGPVAGIGLYF